MDILDALRNTVLSIKAWVNENKVDKTEYNDAVVYVNNKLQSIEDSIYKAIAITNFSAGRAEKGQTVTSATLSWSVNKTPKTLLLDGENIDPSLTSYPANDFSATMTSNKTWVLTAEDEKGKTSTRSASITFLSRVYWGVAAVPSSYDSDFILSLSNKELSSGKIKSFTVNAGSGQHIYYCLPSSMGDCIFTYNNCDGGFYRVEKGFLFENSNKYVEPYDIWMSDNAGLGDITIDVS